MKRIYLYGSILFLIFTGCKKNEVSLTTGDFFLKAYKDSSDLWLTNEPYASVVRTDKIIWIGGYKQNENNSQLDELLLLQLTVDDLSNLQKTTIKSVDYNTILEGDIVSDRYVIDTANTNNKIEITDIDETNKIMKGKFTLYLVRDKWFSANGEKTEFKTGEFTTTYTDN